MRGNHFIHIKQPPEIVLKEHQPTNYEKGGKWYISPRKLKTELSKLLLQI